MPARRTTLGTLGALAGLLALPQGAGALELRPCPEGAGFRCGTLRVPLDHEGRVRGSLGLRVAAQARAPRRGAGLLVALSGGPGQASVTAAESFAESLAPALRRHRLVVLDQRGTGASGALSCPNVQRLGLLTPLTPAQVRTCAQRIGPRRAFYRTADTVADLERLRRAFGARRLALLGISYGTWVAQEYARTHPERTERLILDSVVGPDPPDGFSLDSFRRLPRVLREQCRSGRCRGATSDPLADLRGVIERLRARPLRATAYSNRGRRRPVTIPSEEALLSLITEADVNPLLASRFPGALGAARRGDLAPLARTVRAAEGPPVAARELSFGLFLTTICLDSALPFALAAPDAERRAAAAAAAAAIPPADYAPWSLPTVTGWSPADDCLRFPPTPAGRRLVRPLPDVPALILSGRLDRRTPAENGAAVARLLPRARVVEVPGNGHDQVDSDVTGCVGRALGRFAAGRAVGDPCRGRTGNQVRVLPRPPRSLSEVRAPAALPGERGRVLRAVLDTAVEARFSALEAIFAGLRPQGGGLRGGSFSGVEEFYGPLRLRDYQYVPGVRLSGTLEVRDDGRRVSGTVRVAGRLRGSVTLSSATGAAGRLGGRRVRLSRAGAAAAGAAGPALPAALPPVLVERALRSPRAAR